MSPSRSSIFLVSGGLEPWIWTDFRAMASNCAPVSEPGFLDFQMFDSRYFSFCKICSENMLVRDRGINDKGVLGRPCTKWRVSILSRVSPGHLYYLFLDISPTYFPNIFCKKKNSRIENLKIQKPRFTNRCPVQGISQE